MSLNSYLITKFAKNRPDISRSNSPVLRYQILSIFYLNFVLTFLMFLFEIFTWLLIDLPVSRFLTMGCAMGSLLSMACLYKGFYDYAGVIVLIYVHVVNTLTTHFFKAPMAGVFGTFCYLNLSYVITESSIIKGLNSLASFIELILHAKKVLEIFQVTLTEDQYIQVLSGMIAMFIAFAYLSAIGCILINIQESLWKMVQLNFEKSENLTKEVIKTVDAKDSFVSSLSHEVRNVINSLNGSTDYLLNSIKDTVHLNILKNAKLSGEILLNLLNNTLDAAKIKADKLELSFNYANCEDIIRKAFIINSENLKRKDIFAQALLDVNIPEKLWIDTGRLLQILINLMSNAIKFTPKEGRINIYVTWCENIEGQKPNGLTKLIKNYNKSAVTQPDRMVNNTSLEQIPNHHHNIPSQDIDSSSLIFPETLQEFGCEQEEKHFNNIVAFEKYTQKSVKGSKEFLSNTENWTIQKTESLQRLSSQQRIPSCSMSSQTGYLKIQVSDTGCGIAPQDIPKLFEMYNQANSTISSTHGGTGLGLWICKQLCHKMNGDIVISSQINQGADFMFYIFVDNSQDQEQNPGSNPGSRKQREKIRALVVDDYDFNRNLHKLLLEREGVQVTLASDGVEAVNKYREKGQGYFDLVFMDINMPKLDGVSAVKAIRKWEQEKGYEKADVYFISGDYFNEDEVHDRLECSAVKENCKIKFIRKPIEVQKIGRIVEEAKRALMEKINYTSL